MTEKIRLHVNLSDEADRILKVYRKDKGLNRTQAVHRALAIANRIDGLRAAGSRVLIEAQGLTYELDFI